MQFDRYSIPGFREAVEAENIARDAAFLDIPSRICGIEIRQMTPRDFLILDHLGLILKLKLEPDRLSLLKFIWKLRCNWWIPKLLCVWKVWKTDAQLAMHQLEEYFEATFQDTPGGRKSKAGLPNASWVAHQCDLIGSEYGWDYKRTIGIPLRVLNQLINCAKLRHDPEYKVNARHGKVECKRLQELNKSGGRNG